MHIYVFRPRKNKRGVDLILDALPFGRLWYGEPNASSNAVDYAKFYSRSHNAVIRAYDEAGNVIETHERNEPRGPNNPLDSDGHKIFLKLHSANPVEEHETKLNPGQGKEIPSLECFLPSFRPVQSQGSTTER